MPLTFGDTDPYYKYRQLEQLRDVGMMFVQMSSQRKQEEERKRQAEMSRALEMLKRYPEVVDQPAGEDLARRFPELAPIVAVVRDRSKLLGQVNQAGEAWISGADQRAQEHQKSLARKMALAAPHSPFAPPNLSALGSLMEESQVHPDTFLQESAESLTPSQRVAANIWGKERGLKVPEPQYTRRPDPMRDLPQQQRALRIPGTPDQKRAARIQANLEPGARELEQRTREEAKNRRAAVAAEIAERGLDLRERGLDLREKSSSGAGAGYKESRKLLSDTLGTVSERLVNQQKAWDAELKEAQKGLSGNLAKDAAKQVLTERLGPRPEAPPKLLPGHLNRLTRKIVEEASTVEEAEAAMEAVAEWYVRLTTTKKLSPAEAMAVILGEKEEPAEAEQLPSAAELQFLSRGGR